MKNVKSFLFNYVYFFVAINGIWKSELLTKVLEEKLDERLSDYRLTVRFGISFVASGCGLQGYEKNKTYSVGRLGSSRFCRIYDKSYAEELLCLGEIQNNSYKMFVLWICFKTYLKLKSLKLDPYFKFIEKNGNIVYENSIQTIMKTGLEITLRIQLSESFEILAIELIRVFNRFIKKKESQENKKPIKRKYIRNLINSLDDIFYHKENVNKESKKEIEPNIFETEEEMFERLLLNLSKPKN